MKSIRFKSLLIVVFMSIIYFHYINETFAQSDDIIRELLSILENENPDKDKVRRILTDNFPKKSIILVNYVGIDTTEVKIQKLLIEEKEIPIRDSRGKIPFYHVTDQVLNEYTLAFLKGINVHYETFTPGCKVECLSYVTFKEFKKYSDKTFKSKKKKPPISILTTIFAITTIGTFIWQQNEQDALNKHLINYNAASTAKDARLFRSRAETSNSRSGALKFTYRTSAVIFAILGIYDVLVNKPEKTEGMTMTERIKNKQTTTKYSKNFKIRAKHSMKNRNLRFGIELNF